LTVPPFYANWTFWAYAFVWLPFALFVVLYGCRSPWRSTAVGRGLMTLAGAITAVLTFVLVVLAVPIPPEVRDLLRGATLGGVAIAGWLQLKNLVQIQNRHRHERCKDESEPQ
jgi:hypothetical protein